MGVPAFFRWLTRKYSSVVIECVENKTYDDCGRVTYEDASKPNPNGVEFDNLYLDMNGIIHPCTHPEDKPPPRNEDEMMVAIFECIDRLFNIVRPRKLLYMAIDGVAPRAKMNQQRSRRFRASKEAVEKQIEMKRIREKLIASGAILPPEKEKGEHFDSNCITPGTPFMDRLNTCLHYYIHDRLNNHPAWRGIKVILSDANVPGEGEHKIMDYIRKQRAQPDHDPNTQHVLCGADADLIMLGLATHEPNFTIIREEFLPNKPRPCEICSQIGHEMSKCEGITGAASAAESGGIALSGEVKFIFVRLSVMKEYLKRTLAMPNLPFEYDFERVLDDWVFMCFFVGNDFLPHLPSLEIREGAIDRLIDLYKKCVYKTCGYLTDSGFVNLERVQMILNDLGLVEDSIFKERQKRELSFRARDKANKRRRTEAPNFKDMHNSQFAPTPLGRGVTPGAVQNARQEAARFRLNDLSSVQSRNLSYDAKSGLQAMMRSEETGKGVKRKIEDTNESEKATESDEEDPQANDEVRLWESGFKNRYYESKFDVPSDNIQFRYSVALQYVKGLCWVLQYYYQGCASWEWYYPYHYAPFASDFRNIEGLSTDFKKGTKPFNPLEQLMGVFPAASSSHVPAPWAELMSDPESAIIDFYPEDFKIDLNGKKFAWQGVALLPFVDETRLFKALVPYYDQLTDEEKKRNKRGDDKIYVGSGNECYAHIKAMYNNSYDPTCEYPLQVDGIKAIMLGSEDCVEKKGFLKSPIRGLHDVEGNKVLMAKFRDPKYADNFVFPARRLPRAIDPPNVLAPENRSSDYRPMIGFTRNIGQASLGQAGHRMMDHYSGGGRGGEHTNSRNYSSGQSNYNHNNRNQHQGGQSNYNNYNRGGYNNNSNSYGRNQDGGYRGNNQYQQRNWTQGNNQQNQSGRSNYQQNNRHNSTSPSNQQNRYNNRR